MSGRAIRHTSSSSGPSLLWRLLRRNISRRQIAGYAIANLIGLSILMVALQFYRDVTAPTATGEEPFINRDYMIVSKQVSDFGPLLGQSTTFSAEDIADLRAQPWLRKLGVFTPSRFQVYARVNIAGRSMSTSLFFESIPDEFFDRLPSNWSFDPADPRAEIPIVVSKDYLSLYNFGFAASTGMPQISEELIANIPLSVSISGNGRQRWITGRVVGFSSRLNTIAVPEQFMSWANAQFADPTQPEEISRLILEVSNPGAPAVNDYLADNGIEVSGDKSNSSRTAYLLSIVSILVIAIGVIISALSFFILTLSIMLLLQKNASTIHNLLTLGYSVKSVAASYIRMVAVINAAIFVGAAGALFAGRSLWAGPLDSLGMSTVSPAVTILAAGLLMIMVTIVNAMAIRRTVKKNFYNS